MTAMRLAGAKIVRTICGFARQPDRHLVCGLRALAQRLEDAGYQVQTQRVCAPLAVRELDQAFDDPALYLSVGALDRAHARAQLDHFLEARSVAFNLEILDQVEPSDVDLLFRIIRERPAKTFSFAYTFCNPTSSPFFPSAKYAQDGFAIGLQPTDLAQGCESIEMWLAKLEMVWHEIVDLCGGEGGFLGIDSSIAPLYSDQSSLVDLMRRTQGSFERSLTRDVYLRITKFIKGRNPKPVGLCGIMFPCLEDFSLAEEYAEGRFSIERNVYLSLHSGLGIDTYPIGVDESPERVAEILSLLLALAKKYRKPLSARFVSDGHARIGERTSFGNPFLKDVVVKAL